MGNSYAREDSIESQGRQSRSSSILRRYRSLRHKDSSSLSRCSTTDEQDDTEKEKILDDNKDAKEQTEIKEAGDKERKQEGEREEPPEELTELQKEMLKRTWQIIETNVAKVGVVLFMGLFETHPDVQEVFIPFRGLPMEEVQQSKELRSHALRVMGFVEKAVRRLDEPEKLDPLIRECGRNHCHYGAQVQHIEFVGPEFLRAIQPALEEEWTEEVENAWDLLLKHIFYGMREAMVEEMRK